MKKYITTKVNGAQYVKALPIEYKQIDIEDFNKCGYAARKTIINLDNDGYLGENIIKTINVKEKSTDVLNVTTGCGKTTTIYQLIEKITKEEPKAIIIVATPFLSLVEKDSSKLIDKYNIKKETITNYIELNDDLKKEKSSNKPFIADYIKGKKIHITTINALLRNPGDTAFEQKIIKTNYFSSLYQHCVKSKLKVYLFLDEVHASIHNFKNEYIFFLTMWKNVMHKCIISTATYTEPVNIVIKHMAYMTNDIINIFETERTKKKVISPLDMAFFPYKFPKNIINDLSLFLMEYISKNISDPNKQNFHIICYSRKMAERIGGVLNNSLDLSLNFTKIKLLTSNNKEKFQEGYNHIGTNFGTGVDITNPGDLLIIIFPFKYKDEDVKGEEGIFYDGLPSILQVVARLRSKGRILFIIPPMKVYIRDDTTVELLSKINTYKNYIEDSKKSNLKSVPEDFMDNDMAVEIVSKINTYKNNLEDDKKDKLVAVTEDFIKDEKKILDDFIDRRNKKIKGIQDKYHKFMQEEENKAKERESDVNYVKMNRPEIQFPSKDTFILERGQEFIKYRSYKSGKYITPYVLWAALKDQFVNCTLDEIYHFVRRTKSINMNDIQEYLDKNNVNVNTEFKKFYKNAKKSLNEHESDGNTLKLKLFDNNNKRVQINTVSVFWSIVGYYFKDISKGPITNLNDYYIFSMNERNDKSHIYYKQLKEIIHRINKYLNGKSILQQEALIDKNVYQYENDLSYIINNIKENDPVINVYLTTRNAFWTIKSTSEYPYTRYLLQNLFTKGNRKKDGRCTYLASF
jgi:hypothetical protein